LTRKDTQSLPVNREEWRRVEVCIGNGNSEFPFLPRELPGLGNEQGLTAPNAL